jgi:hypothetical protein
VKDKIMRKTFALMLAAALALSALAANTAAQEERFWRPPSGEQAEGEISLYRQTGFVGPHIRAQTAVQDIGRDWVVRSVRVTRGRWQLCTGVNYGGQCTTVTQSLSAIILASPLMRTRSLRPILNTPLPGNGASTGPSLRGMAAAFFTQPSYHGQRIPACARGPATSACARDTAVEFCRVNGYSFLGDVALQTDRGRAYLADVLCKRSAN